VAIRKPMTLACRRTRSDALSASQAGRTGSSFGWHGWTRLQISATRRHLAVVALCDDLLTELKSRIGVAAEIRALLLRDITNAPTLAAVAKLLEMSDRSLRRQLREQGISFRGLRDELRMQIALKYLRATTLANEGIALALGFSDATNFRRAFRRWTNKSPSEIRGEQVQSL
jgi:AraC-like DNA-binding protein